MQTGDINTGDYVESTGIRGRYSLCHPYCCSGMRKDPVPRLGKEVEIATYLTSFFART